MFFDNASYLSLLMKRLYGVLLIALGMNASLAIFFAYKWYQASNLDNVYLLAPDQTLMVHWHTALCGFATQVTVAPLATSLLSYLLSLLLALLFAFCYYIPIAPRGGQYRVAA